MLTGGCFCKAIRYVAGEHAFDCTNCHCTICRGTSGAPCVAWFSVERSAFRFTEGSPAQFRSSLHATRSFCAVCGTQLTFADDNYPGAIDVSTCSLDDPAHAAPQDHTFTDSQLPWLKLNDGLPRFKRRRSEP
jgi:hypothetical protein